MGWAWTFVRSYAVLRGCSALHWGCMLAGQLCSTLSPLFDQQSVQAWSSHKDGRGIKGREHARFLKAYACHWHPVIAAFYWTRQITVQICSQLPSPAPKTLITYQLSVFAPFWICFSKLSHKRELLSAVFCVWLLRLKHDDSEIHPCGCTDQSVVHFTAEYLFIVVSFSLSGLVLRQI